jgi:hypothetical protein
MRDISIDLFSIATFYSVSLASSHRYPHRQDLQCDVPCNIKDPIYLSIYISSPKRCIILCRWQSQHAKYCFENPASHRHCWCCYCWTQIQVNWVVCCRQHTKVAWMARTKPKERHCCQYHLRKGIYIYIYIYIRGSRMIRIMMELYSSSSSLGGDSLWGPICSR